jgi:uncharacterized protein (DUF302 family)
MVNFIKVALLFLAFNSTANDEFLTKKINANFNQTWYSLFAEVKQAKLKTAYLQRCDFALKQRKYKSDKYRILFFGEYEKMEYLSNKYPEIVPFLPLKAIVIEESKNQTLLLANPPNLLLEIVKGKDGDIIKKWQKDMEVIFENINRRYDTFN